MTDIKGKICQKVDEIAGDLVILSNKLHAEPELAFVEHKAAALLTDYLEKQGFAVERGVAGLSTAFRAEKVFGNGTGGMGEQALLRNTDTELVSVSAPTSPTIAFLAEYDALPEIGHACGHNLIAVMALGAAIGLASAEGLAGKVVVLGTPGEEGLGGKINMVEAGVFKDIDYALMVHPSGENMINRGSTALQHLRLSFAGKNAHSSSPEDGINALTAVMQTFDNIDRLRALMPLTANVNGIITKGGTAANIITDHAACEFTARAGTLADLTQVVGYIERAIHAAEVLTEAKATLTKDPAYAEFYPNRAINSTFGDNMAMLGVAMYDPAPGGKYGSSDIGNVSLVVPSMHAYIDIGCTEPGHTAGFASASISDAAHEIALKAAKAMAVTGFDILSDAGLQERINNEFNETVPKLDISRFIASPI